MNTLVELEEPVVGQFHIIRDGLLDEQGWGITYPKAQANQIAETYSPNLNPRLEPFNPDNQKLPQVVKHYNNVPKLLGITKHP